MNAKENGRNPAIAGRFDLRGSGLTKREYFAAMAMQGILSSNCAYSCGRGQEECVKFATECSDKLLEELAKPIDNPPPTA